MAATRLAEGSSYESDYYWRWFMVSKIKEDALNYEGNHMHRKFVI